MYGHKCEVCCDMAVAYKNVTGTEEWTRARGWRLVSSHEYITR